MYKLGEILIELRGNLSLREAAKRSGLSYSYISSLEKGKHPRTGAPIHPTPEILRSLARAYNYPHEELMRVAGYLERKDNGEIAEETQLEKDRKYALDLIMAIDDPGEREKAISYLRFLAGQKKE